MSFVKNKKRPAPLYGSYVLYGADESYFSMKLHSALSFVKNEIPFDFKGKTLTNREYLQKRSETHQIPVFRTPENWLIADTTPILHLLDSRLPKPIFYPPGFAGALVALFEEYFDEWIPRMAVHYRWFYPETAKLLRKKIALSSVDPGTPEDTIEMIGQGINKWGLKACRATGINTDNQRKQGEAELLRVLTKFDAHLAAGNKYFLGDRPSAFDAVVMGSLRAHFLLDPKPKAHIQHLTNIVEYSKRWETASYDMDKLKCPTANQLKAMPFVNFLIKEIMGPFKTYSIATSKALENGDKSFVARIYDEDVSFLCRPYPTRSRKMMRSFIRNHLSSLEKLEWNAFLAQYGLDDTFGVPIQSKL